VYTKYRLDYSTGDEKKIIDVSRKI